MTIRVSSDGGKSWPVKHVLHDGSAAYSCLSVLPDGDLGVLYERDQYRQLFFERVGRQTLLKSD